jgi:hypothetical protein
MLNSKNRNLMKKFYLISIVLLSLASCQQEDIATNGMYSDDFMANLKFNTVNLVETRASLENEPEQTSKNTENDKEIQSNSSGFSIGIFSVRIARPSTGCRRGFGFCDFVWFPKLHNKDVDILLEKHSEYSSFNIKSDSEGNKFVDLELAEKPTGINLNKLQPLVIEEQLEGFNSINNKEKELIVSQGSYSFDRSVGKFGGYRIPLK